MHSIIVFESENNNLLKHIFLTMNKTPIEKLAAYLEFNGIDLQDSYLRIGEIIEKKSYKNILCLNQKTYILTNFFDLINETIDDEKFFLAGDITSTQNIFELNQSPLESMDSLITEWKANQLPKSTLFVIDNLAFAYAKHKVWSDFALFLKAFEEQQSALEIL